MRHRAPRLLRSLVLLFLLSSAAPATTFFCEVIAEFSDWYSAKVEARINRFDLHTDIYATKIRVGDDVFDFPHVSYAQPRRGRTATTEAERFLGVSLGEPAGEGTSRRVYTDPRDPSRVLKIYDPKLVGSPKMVAMLIQRELALETYLRSKGFSVPLIDRNPDLLRRGIISQPKVEGSHPTLPYKRGENPKLDSLLDRIAALDAPVRKLITERFGIKIVISSPLRGGEHTEVGIDAGDHLDNVVIDAAGEPHLVDW